MANVTPEQIREHTQMLQRHVEALESHLAARVLESTCYVITVHGRPRFVHIYDDDTCELGIATSISANRFTREEAEMIVQGFHADGMSEVGFEHWRTPAESELTDLSRSLERARARYPEHF